MFIQTLLIRNTTVYEKKVEEEHVYINTYSKISCIALRVSQSSKGFWVFLLCQSFE